MDISNNNTMQNLTVSFSIHIGHSDTITSVGLALGYTYQLSCCDDPSRDSVTQHPPLHHPLETRYVTLVICVWFI
jgi:hypothetical protein